MSAGACAPRVQAALPADAPAPPRFLDDRFQSSDGALLGLQAWLPKGPARAAIIALHGMNDYSEAFYIAGPAWAAGGCAVYAYDARGFGRSPGRGIWPGTALLVEDLRAAIAAARTAHPGARIAVAGDSMGAATAMAAFGGANPPAADALALVAPAVWGWSALPRSYAGALWLSAHLAPWSTVRPPRFVQRRITPSDNIAMLRKISQDPLMLFETRIDAVYGLVSLMEAAAQGAGRLAAPTAFFYGAKDDIIPLPAAQAAAAALPAEARTAFYETGHHMLLRDLGAGRVIGDVLAFINDPAAPWPSGAPPIPAKTS